MALSEQNKALVLRVIGNGLHGLPEEWANLNALLDAARAEQKEDGSSVAGDASTPFGRTDDQHSAGWFTMDMDPAAGSKFIALYNDGSGAGMFWRHDGGVIDHDGDEYIWPLKGYDRWAYLPDKTEFWCETWPEDPMYLPVTPAENSASSPSEASAGNPATDEQNLPPPSPGGDLNGNGWVYFGPDVGIEYAPEHPIESGETPDATDVRRSTYFEDWLAGELQTVEAKARELAKNASPGGEQEAVGYLSDKGAELLKLGGRAKAIIQATMEGEYATALYASPVRGAGEKLDATDLFEALESALVEGTPTLSLQEGRIWIDGETAFDARGVLLALSVGGENRGSASADLSRASSSPSQSPAGGEG